MLAGLDFCALSTHCLRSANVSKSQLVSAAARTGSATGSVCVRRTAVSHGYSIAKCLELAFHTNVTVSRNVCTAARRAGGGSAAANARSPAAGVSSPPPARAPAAPHAKPQDPQRAQPCIIVDSGGGGSSSSGPPPKLLPKTRGLISADFSRPGYFKRSSYGATKHAEGSSERSAVHQAPSLPKVGLLLNWYTNCMHTLQLTQNCRKPFKLPYTVHHTHYWELPVPQAGLDRWWEAQLAASSHWSDACRLLQQHAPRLQLSQLAEGAQRLAALQLQCATQPQASSGGATDASSWTGASGALTAALEARVAELLPLPVADADTGGASASSAAAPAHSTMHRRRRAGSPAEPKANEQLDNLVQLVEALVLAGMQPAGMMERCLRATEPSAAPARAARLAAACGTAGHKLRRSWLQSLSQAVQGAVAAGEPTMSASTSVVSSCPPTLTAVVVLQSRCCT